jgi:nucleoside-diphosphate-sugar epimerase
VAVKRIISITGVTGFLGRNLLKRLTQCGNSNVRVLIHKNELPQKFMNSGVEIFPGDLMAPDTIDRFILPASTVINLVYFRSGSKEENLTAIHHLIQTCERKKIRRLIHCSTARVSGRVNSPLLTEKSLCRPISDYATTKLEIENTILKDGHPFEIIILRPTAVFGPRGLNLVQFVHDLRNNSRLVNYIRSCLWGASQQNLVYVDNVVSAILFLLSTPLNSRREIFIISDDESPINNYRQVEKFLFRCFDWQDYLLPHPILPLPVLTCLANIMNKSNNPAAKYDCLKILNQGFRKPVPFEEGLTRFAQWYRKEYLQ